MLFLSIQELPFRGTDSTNITDAAKDENIIYSTGIFIAMFSYTIQKDSELKKFMKFIPQNAQYTSPQIQNEVISIMADMVLEHISDKYNKSEMPFFCLKADETKDASDFSTKSNYQYKKKQTKLKSRISKVSIIPEVCDAIWKTLKVIHMPVPTREHWEKMVSTLYQKLEKPISNTLKNYETLSYEKYQSRSKTL
ncbi:unnamed protein product [Gordionus sp. m RMFG-2023]